jgi:LysM repeat protein
MNSHDSEFDDYGPEPNMKLSHAFLVVLFLHVIAVGGLYAFNSMKAGKAPKIVAAKTTAPSGQPTAPSGGDQSPGDQDPKNAPEEKKAPVVAKTSSAPRIPENTPLKTESKKPHQGVLSGIKSAIQHLTGTGAGAASVAVAAAQDTSPASQPAADVNTPAAPAAGTEAVAQTPKTYLVKTGDTITRIASSLGTTIPELETANGLVSSSVLRVGQILKVPEKEVVLAASVAAAQVSEAAGSVAQAPGVIASAATAAVASTAQGMGAAAPADTTGMTEYTVVKGDNPYKIAKKFKITPDDLMKANGITDPKKIQIGQKLKIPASHKKAASKTSAAQ